MTNLLNRYLYIIYAFILLLTIINIFIGSEVFIYINGIITIPILILSFLGATLLFKTLGSIFLLVGLILFLQSGLPFYETFRFITGNLGLLALLAVLPWMNSVVRAGRFDRRINDLMKMNVSNLGKLYVRSTLTSFTLISFISLSAINLSQGVLLRSLTNYTKNLRDTYIAQTTLRAFSMALVWSPMEVLVAITVDATGVSYLTFLPWLVLFTTIMIVLDTTWGRYKYKSIPYETPSNMAVKTLSMKEILKNIFLLFVALAVFLTIVVILSNGIGLNFILSVTLVIFPFACIWAFVMKRWRSFLAIGWKTWKIRTNAMQNFFVLFVSLAFFSNSLSASPLLETLQSPFMAATKYPLFMLFVIQFTYLFFSLLGIHPIATIGILIEIVTPLYEVMNPLGIGIALIIGALSTASVATYGVTVTMTSMNTGQNPYRITGKNMPFTLVFGTIGTFLAYFLL
ncbi:hypothetical protein ACERII_16155 [Evansella sp. AB-rgal1]|uniref:hypothetical protein n=1 Tax=Evansella sp. AB-rgal1 TaxID=3242696 RepID=UPI00359EC507